MISNQRGNCTSLVTRLPTFNGSKRGARSACHLKTTNVLFCDGHVKAMKVGTLNQTHLVGTANIRYLFTIQDD